MNNSVNLIGRLTKDPELSFIPTTGTATCRFTLAVNRRSKKEGQPDADFFNIVCFGKNAENLANYQSKGSLVSIGGSLRNRSWDQDGVKKYITEINANDITFLSSKKDSNIAINEEFTPVDDEGDMPF